jgi:SAM-dependent methyltransferase
VRTFMKRLAPAWLDHVALLRGFAPPPRAEGFAWCELGCGQGVTPVVLAATHSRGRFYGVDVMPEHIDHARRLAAEAGASNAAFYAADFSAADRLGLPKFDYIVAHGVYTWIDADSQNALLRFIDSHLAPGGLVYLSYNALPGWARNLALREILLRFGMAAPGDSLARVAAAVAAAHEFASAGAPALVGSRAGALASLDKHYLAHEYLVENARPLFVTELRVATAAIGLAPVGNAHLLENYDRFVVRAAARKTLERIRDENLRELARDCFINTGFRADVFARQAERIDEAAQVRRLFDSVFMLARPAAAIAFRAETSCGTLKFGNDCARRIVAELAKGPRRLAEIRRGSFSRRDLLANALTLCAVGDLWPVEPSREPPVKLTQAVYERLDGPDEILFLPLSNGAALTVPRGLLQRLRDGHSLDDYPGWHDYLGSLSRPDD